MTEWTTDEDRELTQAWHRWREGASAAFDRQFARHAGNRTMNAVTNRRTKLGLFPGTDGWCEARVRPATMQLAAEIRESAARHGVRLREAAHVG